MDMRTSLVGLAVAALTLAACGTGSDQATGPDPASVTLTASDYAFDLPDEIAAGLVTFDLINDGAETHHAQLVRLNQGGSFDAALAALGEEDLETVFEHVSLAGGVGVVAPAANAAATVELTPGSYAFLCALESPDGIPHLARGMLRTFTVTGPATDEAPVIETVGEIALNEFAFDLPDTLEGKVAVTNAGQQPHELLMIRLAEGVGVEEALASLDGPPPTDGPPPAVPAGGLQAIMPGDTGYLDLDTLEAGTYALICFLPDPASGKPHLELGMVSEIHLGT